MGLGIFLGTLTCIQGYGRSIQDAEAHEVAPTEVCMCGLATEGDYHVGSCCRTRVTAYWWSVGNKFGEQTGLHIKLEHPKP